MAAVARESGEEWIGFEMGSDLATVISWSRRIHKIASASCTSVAWFSRLIRSFHVWKMGRREKLAVGAKFRLDWRAGCVLGRKFGRNLYRFLHCQEDISKYVIICYIFV